jgi:two-component system sensor histidine kinase QseC
MMSSIRSQLVVRLLGGLFVLFALFSAILYLYVWHVLLKNFDRALMNKVVTFAGLSEIEDNGELGFDFTELSLREYQPSSDAEYFQVWDKDGRTLARSPSLKKNDLPHLSSSTERPEIQDLVLPDGRRGRAAFMRVSPRSESESGTETEPSEAYEGEVDLVIAKSTEELDHTMRILLVGMLFFAFLLLLGAMAIVHSVVGRSLLPLDAIGRETASIEAAELGHRFPEEGLPDEIRPISHRLNELLSRLETAFKRERRFTADVAHELRTPIAELRALAEVGLEQASSRDGLEDPKPFLQDALDIASHLERLVGTLLSLVRCQAGRQVVHQERFDLSALIQETWARYKGTASEKELVCKFRLPAKAPVETDRSILAAVLSNLFSNAATHSPRGGELACYVACDNGQFMVTLRNANKHISQEDLEHLFDPFWQKDPSRSDAGHSGLGLSLVSAYAALLDLNLKVTLPGPDIFEITFCVKRDADAVGSTGHLTEPASASEAVAVATV